MPRDGTIKRKLTVMVVAGALTPLVVAAFAVGALVIAGGQAVGIAAVVVIAVALSIAVYVAGTQRVRVLHDRFDKATKLANEVATVRLPEALEAARDGRTVDNGHAAFVPDEHDELSEIIAAFDRTQRTAITLAAEQARVRRQASEMFVDLGRRHQALLSRTLTLVTELEASERDPATVTELLRLDHLVTRMRRNAESLLVLAGSEPGRGRPTDTGIADVVRNALQEIEAYDRVDAQQLERGRVAGRVVAAVSHLLAELLENATMFSPPDSRVTITGQRRPDGYVLSIVDHGIGLEPDELDAANSRLAQFRSEFTPPRRLGLAVVAELARRHGIVVQLQPTPSGGTTASVLLSPVLLAGADDGIAAARAAAPVPAAPERPIPAPLPESLWAAGPQPPTRVAEPVGTAAAAPVDVIDLTRVEPVAVAGDGGALPRRVPGEQIPDLGPQRDDTDAPRRDGIDVAAQLNGFQEGVERARAHGDADGTPSPLDFDDIDDVVDVTGDHETDVERVAPSTADAADPTPFTAAGLERRVAGEHLPDTGPARDPSATSPNREPDDVRNALTSFQYGVARGTLERVEPLNGEERP